MSLHFSSHLVLSPVTQVLTILLPFIIIYTDHIRKLDPLKPGPSVLSKTRDWSGWAARGQHWWSGHCPLTGETYCLIWVQFKL